jgi:hypothetical protein
MTEEEQKSWQQRCMRFQSILEGNPPPPSLEARLEWLEADASAQRTAIIRLERVVELIFKSLLALFMVCAALALAVLT